MSHQRWSVFLVVASLSSNAWAQGTDAAAQEVRQLEDALTQALVERDAAALDRLWHADLIFIGTNGAQTTKAERLAGQSTAAPRGPEANTNDAVTVRIEGDTAIVTVLSTWTFATDPPTMRHFRALHVWIRDDARWQLLAAQVAILPE